MFSSFQTHSSIGQPLLDFKRQASPLAAAEILSGALEFFMSYQRPEATSYTSPSIPAVSTSAKKIVTVL